MQGHQRQLVALLLKSIKVGHQRDLLQKSSEPLLPRHGFVPRGDVEKLLYIFPAVTALFRAVQQGSLVARSAENNVHQLVKRLCRGQFLGNEQGGKKILRPFFRLCGKLLLPQISLQPAETIFILLKRLAEYLEGNIADPAGRHVHNSHETHQIARILRQAQISEYVLYLLPFIKFEAADDLVRHAASKHELLERPALGVRAVQHDHLPEVRHLKSRSLDHGETSRTSVAHEPVQDRSIFRLIHEFFFFRLFLGS